MSGKRKFSTTRIPAGGFLLAIAAGTVLLSMFFNVSRFPDLEMGIRVANQIAEGGYSTSSRETPEAPGPQPGYLGPE